MYMLSADKLHATLEIRPFKGHLNSNYIKKIEEGKIIQFNRYHVASRQKVLEELANKIKAQWISETQELIVKYRELKIQLK
ncbi:MULTISPECIES: hypothetical protein [unclassified Clostridium]|uniref:hypothetical protein n=1 Tax=unclassified Clostridium TaxID=2614128 RepID=UPI000297B5F6|nr:MULTISPECIES: hypothetical protein [unclassified Clostridium]EKQ55069.1 MAG: hypothetical protein A370_02843 [Clostridium sp. Maddingley MBC34-26]